MTERKKSLLETIAKLYVDESWRGVANIARGAKVKLSPEAKAAADAEKAAAAAKKNTPAQSTEPSGVNAEIGQIPSNKALVPTTPKVPATTITPKPVKTSKVPAIAAGTAALGGAGYLAYKAAKDEAGVEAKPAPAAPKAEAPAKPAAKAAPAKPKERFIDTAAVYAKHGVGSNDESPGAFHRAEAEIEALKKANPTHIDPRSSSEYAGRLTQQRAEDEAAAKKAAAPKAPAAPKAAAPAPTPKAETPTATPAAPKAAPADSSILSPAETAPGMTGTFKPRETTVDQDIENARKFTKPKEKVDESMKYLSMNPSSTNMFAEAKKLKGNQDKLDKNENGKLDSEDFKMLRGEKVEEEKKADKDYDGDGKVESSKDEVWGSRFKAAKKAGKMEEAAEPALKKSTTTDPDFAAPSANPDAPESPIKYVPAANSSPSVPANPPLPPKRPAGLKEAYLDMLKRK